MALFIGDLRIDRVEEFCGPSITAEQFLVGLPEDAIEANADWFLPEGADLATKRLVTSVHCWVVRTGRHVVLIDTCYGNCKSRPTMPHAHALNLPWLDRLATAGIRPEDVDFVMCTHLHADHVGWNTRLVDGRWVPTFPNARYLFGRTEFAYWQEVGSSARGWGQEGVFEDSVLPCMEAGLATLVDDGYCVDDMLTVQAAPGHTAGHAVIRAWSAGAGGLFTGDSMHTPLQVVYPHVNSKACAQPDLARQTRLRLLAQAADDNLLLLPTHFPPPFCGRVRRDGDGFRYLPGG